jgi:hypothetical protein
LPGYAYDPKVGVYTKTLTAGSKIRILEDGDGGYEVYFIYACQSLPGAIEVKVTELSQFDLGRSLTKLEDAISEFHSTLIKSRL